MKKTLFVSDLDGTINHIGFISSEDVEAIRSYRERGNDFAIATGRCFQSGVAVLKKYHIDFDYYIACSGAYILDREGNCLYLSVIRTENVFGIIRQIRNSSAASYDLSDGNDVCMIPLVSLDEHPYHDDPELYSHYHGNENKMLEEGKICEISCVFDSQVKAEAFAAKLSSLYPDISVHINRNDLDITHKNTSKHRAVKILSEIKTYEKIYTIGDSLNDYQMLQENCGFAMKDGDHRLKETAEYVVDNVAQAIEVVLNHHCLLVCSEIDGTLVRQYENPRREILNEDVEAINGFVEADNDFALVSGRSLYACLETVEEYGLKYSYIISNSGGQITDQEGTCLYLEKISEEDSCFILDLIRQYDVESYEVSDGNLVALHIFDMSKVSDETLLRKEAGSFSGDENSIRKNHQIVQISVHFFEEETQNSFIEELEMHHTNVIVHINNLDIDITSSDCSKFRAIEYLDSQNRYSHVYSIGDGLNDLEMIEKYDGFAVTNAHPDLLQKARRIVNSVAECIGIIEEENNENRTQKSQST